MSLLVRSGSSDSLTLTEGKRGSFIKVKVNKEVKTKVAKKKNKNKTGVEKDDGTLRPKDSESENDWDKTVNASNAQSEVRTSRKKRQVNPEQGSPTAVHNKGYESNDDEDSGTATGTFRRRRQPITAWSDTSEPDIRTAENRSERKSVNSSPNHSSAYNSSEETDMQEMLQSLNDYIERTEQSLAGLKKQRKKTEKASEDTCDALEQRRLEIEEELKRCFNSMVEDVMSKSADQVERLDACIKTSESNLRGMRKIYEKYSTLPDSSHNCDKLKTVMSKVEQRYAKVVPPDFTEYKIQTTQTPEEQTSAIKSLLGLVENQAGKEGIGETCDNAATMPTSLTLPDGFLEVPQLIASLSCRMKKDKRSCGITDIALTDDGRLFAVDNNNKSVKIFDSIQNGGLLTRVLGREVLQKPSRISYLASQDRIVVTDDGTKSLRVFSGSEFADLGTLCPPVELESFLHQPAGHCELPDGRFAVIDFKSKSVILWHLTEGTGRTKIITNMDCPAYLAVTATGRIAITDWKSNKFSIFETIADTSASAPATSAVESTSTPSRDNQKPLCEPHGVCCDSNGLVFVADRREHNVRVFHELLPISGPSLAVYDDTNHKVGVPFAISCNSHGMLAIADYVGTIRIYKYVRQDDDCK